MRSFGTKKMLIHRSRCSGPNNENGGFPVGVTVWSGDDTYTCQILFMYVHVGGGAWIVNILGNIILYSPLVMRFISDHQEGIVNDSTKFRVNPTNRH